MNFYISTFYNVRYLTENCIPISTAVWDPKWFTMHIDKNNVMNGIREEALSPKFLPQEAHVCSKECNYKNLQNCPFKSAYTEYLNKVDLQKILDEFKQCAEDVREITHYSGEPNIVLLVYELPNNPCSERAALIDLFAKYGLVLKEATKDTFNKC